MKLSQDYIKSSNNWDKNTGVRSSTETFDLDLEVDSSGRDQELSWHLPSYSAILRHKALADISEQQKNYIQGMQLLEFVTKQTSFEIDFVNHVAAKLAHARYTFKLPERLRSDALKVYTDEGYHSYYTQKLAFQIRNYYGVEEVALDSIVSNYYRKIYNSFERYGQGNRELCHLAFVIAGENQIVADISQEMKGIVYPAVRALFREHMKDEVFHAKFFSNVFKEVWEQLGRNDREIMALYFCDCFELLALPRTDIYYLSLGAIGFDRDTIERIISEIYTSADWSGAKIANRMAPTLNLLREAGVFESEGISMIFSQRQYI